MIASKTGQYPAQTGPYKVFVKDKGLWQQHAVARLQISMANPKHNGEKFAALCEWAAPRFEHFTLIVSDTLHRHNLATLYSMNAQQAHDRSLKMGDSWLKENASSINLLPNKSITRWDDWLSHKNFKSTFEILMALYETNPEVQQAIQEKAAEFTRRHGGDPFNLLAVNFFQASVDYILEEVAVFACMFCDNHAVDVYPGSWFKEIFDVLAIADPKTFASFQSAKCLRVGFVKNKTLMQAAPQSLKVA